MRAISGVLVKRVSDPRIVGMISVTRIDITPDWGVAYVYVSVLPAKYEKRSLHGLRNAEGRIHRMVCKEVAMRAVPRLEFRLDDTLKKQDEVFEAIQRGVDQDGVASDEDEAPCQVTGSQEQAGFEEPIP